jgi:hypothetical protein
MLNAVDQNVHVETKQNCHDHDTLILHCLFAQILPKYLAFEALTLNAVDQNLPAEQNETATIAVP